MEMAIKHKEDSCTYQELKSEQKMKESKKRKYREESDSEDSEDREESDDEETFDDSKGELFTFKTELELYTEITRRIRESHPEMEVEIQAALEQAKEDIKTKPCTDWNK